MRKFEIDVLALGFNNKQYPGAFTPKVESIIKTTIWGKVLHLYSGTSKIGDIRVDIEHPNATINCKVEDYINNDDGEYDWIILDPPYAISRKTKLKGYGINASLSADVVWRRKIKLYMLRHTNNVLWLDYCAPMIKGFKRKKLWLLLPGGYHNVRVLSWLEREMKLLI